MNLLKKIGLKIGRFILLPAAISYLLQVLVFCSITGKSPYVSSDNFLGEIILFLFVFLCSKTIRKAYVFYTVVVLVLYFSHAVKYLYLGSPVLVSDVLMASESFEVLPYVLKYVVFLIILVPFAVGVWAISFKTIKTYLVLTFVLFALYLSESYPVKFENYLFSSLNLKKVTWNQYLSFKRKGPVLFLFADYLEYKSNLVSSISKSEWESIRHLIKNDSFQTQADQVINENIYVIVLESYLDSKKILETTLDPFDLIRVNNQKLQWKEMLSPRFGNGTATAEFELLCGFPYYKSLPAFYNSGFKNIECLPKLASDAGYHTVGFHPNRSGFFNRKIGYPGIGFDQTFFLENIDPSGKPRSTYMLDDELFQKLESLMSVLSKKQFNYVLTAGLHSPYHQEIVTAEHQKFFTKPIPMTAKKYFVRQLQTSKSLSKFIDFVVSKDPNAKIFITTDHAPPLQKIYAGVSLEQKHIVKYAEINIGLDLPHRVSSYEVGARLKEVFGFRNKYKSIQELQLSKDLILRPLDADFMTFGRKNAELQKNTDDMMSQLDVLFRYYWSEKKQ